MKAQPSRNQRFGHSEIHRRTLLTTGSFLLTCSLAGLLTGAATALVQQDRQGLAQKIPLTASQKRSPNPPLPQFTVQHLLRFSAHRAIVRAVAFSPDGRMLASGGDDAQLLLWQLDGIIHQRIPHLDAVSALAWSPSGRRLATGSGRAVAFVETGSGRWLSAPRSSHRALVTGLAWSGRPGHPVVSCSLDKQVLIWETLHYRKRDAFLRHTAPLLAISCPLVGTTVASCSQGGLIRVWSLDTLQEVHGFYQDAPVALHTVAFDTNGTRLVAGGDDGVVRLWEDGRFCQQMVLKGNEQSCADLPQRLLAHRAAVRALAFSPDGSLLATGGDDAHLCLWDAKAGLKLLTTIVQDAPVLSLSWSPDGQFLAAATGSAIVLYQLP